VSRLPGPLTSALAVDAANAEVFDLEEFLDAVFERLGDAPDAADVAAVE